MRVTRDVLVYGNEGIECGQSRVDALVVEDVQKKALRGAVGTADPLTVFAAEGRRVARSRTGGLGVRFDSGGNEQKERD